MRGNCLIEKSTGRLIRGFNDSVIPNDGTIKIIDEYSFMSQTNFSCSVIPEGVTKILNYAFQQTNISSISLPSTLTEIGGYAFCYTSLSSVTIPRNVSKIGTSAWHAIDELTTIQVESENAYYKAINNCLIEISTGKLLLGLNDSIIPTDGSVKEIANFAFMGKTELSNVVIPSSVTKIGDNAFSNCQSLTELIIPSSVTEIGSATFNHCIKLKKVTIENGSNLKTIGVNAFYNCNSLTEFNFGNNTTNWFYTSSSTATSGTTLSSLDLANTSTTADYLTKTYSQYFWKRV